ncbi:MAG: excinuclease ABC subunit UvrA [Coriobacteriales bacterium]|jgi:excinuclease ABC subunit A|nr:excinuclease ABC subunit UvrA [Coriobacteriales bacterium]
MPKTQKKATNSRNPEKLIRIRGARQHNLKDINLDIPRDQLVVITGLSGSGKSSLAFDTIYAEGQRRYVESLSSYARQFLGQMDKPDLDSIDGLSPAVSIDQKSTSRNPRSTVGTVTEIYDYLRLLFARIGVPHCPECGRVIEAQTTDQVADKIMAMSLASAPQRKALMLAPVVHDRKGEFAQLFADLLKEGFVRVRVDGKVLNLNEVSKLDKKLRHDIDVVVDRIVIKEGATKRVAEAVETATRIADGNLVVELLAEKAKDEASALEAQEEHYSLALACPEHGHSIESLEPRDFSFNAPYGACPTCLGLGFTNEVDPSLVVSDPSLSLRGGASPVINWASNYYPQKLGAVAKHLGISLDTPWQDYPKKIKVALMEGLGERKVRIDYHTLDGRDTYWFDRWEGLMGIVRHKYHDAKSEKQKQKWEKYIATAPCPDCHGARLRPEILAVTLSQEKPQSLGGPAFTAPSGNGNLNIYELTQLSAGQALDFFEGLELSERQQFIGARIVKEIRERLRFMVDVGLDYLTLDRAAMTLSGGEAQRIRLATQIGAGLMGVLYVLDEPSIGLHQRDNDRLIATLKHLRDLGNTVIVVEHDEDTIRQADYVVDIGPGAGAHGGQIVAEGTPAQIEKVKSGSLTADYLSGRRRIELPAKRRKGKGKLRISGVTTNNLKKISVSIPLGTLTVVSGVSGSGKSSLVTDTLAPALANRIMRAHHRVGYYSKMTGLDRIDKVVDIDQSPIGRTPRSNPATYVGVWDDIRQLLGSLPESRVAGFGPGRFSFNVSGGRCEACKGDGQIKIEMHFLPDIYVPCEVCGGSRYNRETLAIKYRGKNVAEILDMTVAEALEFFRAIPGIARKLQTLYDVGLGYIKLGQPATTLSGGEAQRVKLSSELQRVQTGKTFYILDEPTTGLHFEDVRQLLVVLQRLVDSGNTVLVIEHNLDVVKSADYLIDLGPEGGEGGGLVVATGTPEQVAAVPESYTGQFLKKMLE